MTEISDETARAMVEAYECVTDRLGFSPGAKAEAMKAAAQVLAPEDSQIASVWRRGVMCAVERLDTELAGRVFKYQLGAKLTAVRAVLNELDTFCHNTDPVTYQEAFRISENFNRAARGLLPPPAPTEAK